MGIICVAIYFCIESYKERERSRSLCFTFEMNMNCDQQQTFRLVYERPKTLKKCDILNYVLKIQQTILEDNEQQM